MKPAGANYKPSGMVFARTKQAAETELTLTPKDGVYTAAKIISATPPELILIMFEKFLAMIPDIKSSIEKKVPGTMEPDAERAQAIVDELINSLDFGVEMSRDLGAIYFYVRDRIMEANLKFDAGIWDHIEATMRPIYEGFKEAARAMEAESGKQAKMPRGAAIVAGMTYGQGNLKEVVVNTRTGLKI